MKNVKDIEENLQAGDIGGMGAIKFPASASQQGAHTTPVEDLGSGDVPAGRKEDEEEEETSEMKYIYTFKSFLNERLEK